MTSPRTFGRKKPAATPMAATRPLLGPVLFDPGTPKRRKLRRLARRAPLGVILWLAALIAWENVALVHELVAWALFGGGALFVLAGLLGLRDRPESITCGRCGAKGWVEGLDAIGRCPRCGWPEFRARGTRERRWLSFDDDGEEVTLSGEDLRARRFWPFGEDGAEDSSGSGGPGDGDSGDSGGDGGGD